MSSNSDDYEKPSDVTRDPALGDHAGELAPSAPLTTNGQPNGEATVWCKKCDADVKPIGKGRCPHCGTFLPSNSVARRHPVNKLRKEQLLDTFARDYKPTSPFLRGLCEDLAGIREQLDHIKPGSPEWSRLIERQQSIGAQLETSRPPAHDHADIDAMSLDEVIAETITTLRTLLDMRDAEQRSDTSPAASSSPFDSSPIPDPVTIEPPALALQPDCAYCKRPCVGPDHDAYSMLHWDDPSEVDKRAKRATAEMYESLRRQHYGDPWIR